MSQHDEERHATVPDPTAPAEPAVDTPDPAAPAQPDRKASASGTVPATIDEVWATITGLDALPDVLRHVARVERIEGEGFEPGVRWREYMAMGGRTFGEEMWVIEAEAPHRATVGSSSGGVDFVTTFALEASGDQTELAIDTAAFLGGATTSQRLTWRALGPLMMRDTRKALEGDIEDVAAFVRANHNRDQ